MEEQIAYTCRTVACQTRLHLLNRLLEMGPLAPCQLAGDLKLHAGTVVTHLRRLRQIGFLTRESQDGHKLYSLNRIPSQQSFNQRMLNWVLAELASIEEGTFISGEQMPEPASAIFRAVVVFASERRVRILHTLADDQSLSIPELIEKTELSRIGVTYHLRKLVRHEMVQARPKGKRDTYRLGSLSGSAIRQDLYDIVAEYWSTASEETEPANA